MLLLFKFACPSQELGECCSHLCCWLQQDSNIVLLLLAPDCLSKVVGRLCSGPANLELAEGCKLFVRSDPPIMVGGPSLSIVFMCALSSHAPFTVPHCADCLPPGLKWGAGKIIVFFFFCFLFFVLLSGTLAFNPGHWCQNSSPPLLLILEIGFCGHHLRPSQNPTDNIVICLGYLVNKYMKHTF
ncbi:unnamed protein product [Nyctereutes procyonoides]|uniref:(raccoon dog) hypothetical protein n=1 Tax=Nyctereutes procyonoides TaxID=34880 RepID=A0A811Z277_NYCPR|nr:unnamed protein product [Nyctereutes procyonoides]